MDIAAAILANEIIQSLGFTVFPVLKSSQIIVDLIEGEPLIQPRIDGLDGFRRLTSFHFDLLVNFLRGTVQRVFIFE